MINNSLQGAGLKITKFGNENLKKKLHSRKSAFLKNLDKCKTGKCSVQMHHQPQKYNSEKVNFMPLTIFFIVGHSESSSSRCSCGKIKSVTFLNFLRISSFGLQ